MKVFALFPAALLSVGTPAAADDDLQEALAAIRRETDVPALGALVMRDGKEEAIAVVGRRRAGRATGVKVDDRWHIGSDTKAMTATLVARFVEAGELSFETTMAEAFPDFADALPDPARAITLEQLLAHTAGLPANPPAPLFAMLRTGDATVVERRRELARWALGNDLLSDPGEAFHYSNVGYVVVGAALESRFGKPWEDLIARELFEPLGIETFGFGGPPGQNPRGHIRQDGNPEPVGTGFLGDNPAAYGPAGTVHMCLRDWMKFASDQLAGARAEPGTLLKPESYHALHRPRLQNYALGWSATDRSPQRLSHDGSNTFWYARATLYPEENFGYLIVTNEAGDRGKDALNAVETHLRKGR
ncbi:N/A [soil metagenome]